MGTAKGKSDSRSRIIALRHARTRFTPTLVGKTQSLPVMATISWVHPHACGENSLFSTKRGEQPGSPPRLWGKLARRPPARPAERFTPTLVGKTCKSGRPSQPRWVHPHACGENGNVLSSIMIILGSPPRLWGKLKRQNSLCFYTRFTPTLVGKTRRWLPLKLWPSVHPHACGENMKELSDIAPFRGSPPRLWGKLPALTSRPMG